MKSYNYQPSGALAPITTTGNIDDLDFLGCGLIPFNNASLSTLRGLKAGKPGQEVTIINIGASEVDLANQNGSSVAANRFINPLTTASMPLGVGGSATYKYDDSVSRWRQKDFNQGNPINVPYSAGNFTASAGTWTVDSGDQGTYSYIINPAGFMLLTTFINTTTTSGMSTASARIAIPGGWLPSKTTRTLISVITNGVGASGLAQAVVSQAFVDYFTSIAASGWPDSTNNNYVLGYILIPIS